MIAKYYELSEKLQGDYKEIYEEIYKWANIHNVDGDIGNGKMMDLLDLLIEAQQNHRNIKEVIGEDTEEFCEDFFDMHETTDFIKNFASRYAFFSFFIAIITSVAYIQKYDVYGIVLISYIIAMVLDMGYNMLVYTKKVKSPVIVHKMIPYVLFAGIGLMLYELHMTIDLSWYIPLVFSLILALALTLFNKYARYEVTGSYSSVNHFFKDKYDEQAREYREKNNKYAVYNREQARKGLPELSYEEIDVILFKSGMKNRIIGFIILLGLVMMFTGYNIKSFWGLYLGVLIFEIVLFVGWVINEKSVPTRIKAILQMMCTLAYILVILLFNENFTADLNVVLVVIYFGALFLVQLYGLFDPVRLPYVYVDFIQNAAFELFICLFWLLSGQYYMIAAVLAFGSKDFIEKFKALKA